MEQAVQLAQAPWGRALTPDMLSLPKGLLLTPAHVLKSATVIEPTDPIAYIQSVQQYLEDKGPAALGVGRLA